MEKQENEYQTIIDSLKDSETREIDKRLLKNFIEEHIELKKNAEEVYTEITGGLLNKSHYSAETVLSVYRNLQKSLVNRNTVYEDLMNILGKHIDEGLQEVVKEYFGKQFEDR